MAPGGAGGAESGGGVVLVPGSRHRPHLHRRSGPGTGIPAPRSRLLVAPSAGGGRSEDLRVGGRSERGRRVTAARCAAGRPVAADPVSRRRPAGAVGPTNNGSAGEKGLLCQRPCRWRRGARAARNRAAAWFWCPAPGTGPICTAGPAPAPASRHRGPVSWWRLRRAGGGLRICAWEVGAREGVGSLQLVARRAGRLRPTPYLGAARPVPWGRLITVVPGRKACCVSALVDGARRPPLALRRVQLRGLFLPFMQEPELS